MAQEIGDAVLRFLGDSTDLDVKFDGVRPKAEEAFGKGADEVDKGTKRMKGSMHEARGEAALLGEAFGIHLPRHVRSFIAEIPGVGQALQAAFSATAILFVANAIVDATKKLTEFVASHIIYTDAMKESNKATIELNKSLLEQAAGYDKAKEALKNFGAAGVDSLRLQLNTLRAQVATTKEKLAQGEEESQQRRGLVHQYAEEHGWLSKSYDVLKAWVVGGKNQFETIKAQTAEVQNRTLLEAATLRDLEEQQKLLEKQLVTQEKLEGVQEEKKVRSSLLSTQKAQAEAAVALDGHTAEKRQAIKEHFEDEQYKLEVSSLNKQLAVLKENDENTKEAQRKLYADLQVMAFRHEAVIAERLQKAKDELLKTLNDMGKAVDQLPPITIIKPAFVQNLEKGIKAAHDMGITMRMDVAASVRVAQKALDDFAQSGIKDSVVLAQLQGNLKKAEKALQDFGKTEARFKITSHGLFRQLEEDSKTGADAMLQWKQIGANALSDVSTAAASALSNLLLAQGSFGEAMKRATEQVLASVASQALVQGIFDEAKSFEASARYDYGSAAQYQSAANTMFIVAALAGGAAAGMSHTGGGSGGGGSNAQGWNSVSNTDQTNRSGGNSVSVQHFAEGGLVTQPTLSLLAEKTGTKRGEGVIPLDDPKALKSIGSAIGEHSNNSGGGLHVYVQGLVSDDKLVKIMGKMSKLVMGGKAQLHASNSLRVTKRSI